MRAKVDILRKVEKDLRNLPRHQWDSYLWDFCSRFVRLRGGDDDTVDSTFSSPPHRGGE